MIINPSTYLVVILSLDGFGHPTFLLRIAATFPILVVLCSHSSCRFWEWPRYVFTVEPILPYAPYAFCVAAVFTAHYVFLASQVFVPHSGTFVVSLVFCRCFRRPTGTSTQGRDVPTSLEVVPRYMASSVHTDSPVPSIIHVRCALCARSMCLSSVSPRSVFCVVVVLFRFKFRLSVCVHRKSCCSLAFLFPSFFVSVVTSGDFFLEFVVCESVFLRTYLFCCASPVC